MIDGKKPLLRKGQKVKYKDDEADRYGVVLSTPAAIGDINKCKIPGGQLVLWDYAYVKWKINQEEFICLEYIKELDIVRR